MSNTTEKCTCENGFTCEACAGFPDDTTEEEMDEWDKMLDDALGSGD